MEKSAKTPIRDVADFDLTSSLDTFVRQAFFRRSRNLPANIKDMVAVLKEDLLKAFPDCPLEKVDFAITTSTLNDNDQPLSVAFFFAAVKKQWWQPKTNHHNWDEAELARPDTEQDTLDMLDTAADILADQDAKADEPKNGGIAITLPAFNARRSYAYLVRRGQLDKAAARSKLEQAIKDVNADRIKTRHPLVVRDKAILDKDVQWQAMRLAVLDWLRSRNTIGTKPSASITPDEYDYRQFRRTTP